MTDTSAFFRFAGDASRRPVSRRLFLRSCAAGLLASCVEGCDDSTGPDEERRNRAAQLTARPGDPTLTPRRGRTPLDFGAPRDGILYVPDSYDPDVPAPLFIGLHGAGGRAGNWVSYPDRAEERGMIFLAIDSRNVTWDLLQGGYGPDVDFLDRALHHTFERTRIDPDRLALGGFSDGASYALSLGLENADLFSHLVGYSPGLLTVPGAVLGRPSVFISHGNADQVLPVSGTRTQIVPHLREEGYDVTFVEFDGGHGVPSAISRRALDWFTGVAE